jgi:ribosome-binding protein aMBF1 (putative translation factor)
MSKFLLTGAMLVLLASFLHYSPASNEAITQTAKVEVTSFPVSEQVKIARMERKMSQKDLAREMGWSRLTVEQVESGQVTPTKDSLKKLEAVLKTKFTATGY